MLWTCNFFFGGQSFYSGGVSGYPFFFSNYWNVLYANVGGVFLVCLFKLYALLKTRLSSSEQG